MASTSTARAKILYLVGLSTGLFFIDQPWVLLAIAGLQLGLYTFSGLPHRRLWAALGRLKWLAIIVVISHLLIPSSPNSPSTLIETQWFSFGVHLQELTVASSMLVRIFCLLTTSVWVRDSERPGEFIAALRWYRIPMVVAIAIDAGLQLSTRKSGGGQGGGRAKGEGGQGAEGKIQVTLRQLRAGKLDFFDDLLRRSFRRAEGFLSSNYPELNEDRRHDTTIILSVVAAVMSLKLLQLLPGMPIAPGHKNLIIVPLMIMAALGTRGRWGASSAGLAIGIASFMMGYGKFGILEVAHFALPGIAADLLAPVFLVGGRRLILFRLALFGAVIGLTRFAANFLVLMLAGSPALAWVLFTPMLVSQILFGALSSLMGVYVLDKIQHGNLLGTSMSRDEPSNDLDGLDEGIEQDV